MSKERELLNRERGTKDFLAPCITIVKCDRYLKVKYLKLSTINQTLEPTEAQYLVLNALDTLGLLEGMFYDEEKGFWYLTTPSLILPTALLLQNGDIAPTSWASEL